MLKKLMIPGVAVAVFLVAAVATLAAQGRLGEAMAGFAEPETVDEQGDGGPNPDTASDEPAQLPTADMTGSSPTRRMTIDELKSLVEEATNTRDDYLARMAKLREREKRLETLQEEIKAEKATIQAARDELDKRQAGLDARDAELKKKFIEIDSVNAAALKRLAKFYEAMDETSAAAKLAAEDPEEAARIMFFMSDKAGAKVLEAFPAGTKATEVLKYFKALHEEAAETGTGGAT